MRIKHLLLFALIICPGYISAQTPSEAFTAGQAAAQAVTSSAATNIKSGGVQNTLGGLNQSYYQYSTTAPEAALFAGGNGDTFTPGASKITSCQTSAPNSNSFLQQNCNAINLMARNPSQRPQFSINPNSALIQNSLSIQSNASSLTTQYLGTAATSGTFSGCQNTTTTTPATYTTEVCSSAISATSQACSVGRTIVVNAYTNYQCRQTANSYETLNCNRGVTVTVGFGKCTPGSLLGRASFVDCPSCVDPYMAMNISCGSNGLSYDIEPFRSYDGVHLYDYTQLGYAWNGSYGHFTINTTPGMSVVDQYVSNLGFGCNLYLYFSVVCDTISCIPSMRNVSSGCASAGGKGTGAPLAIPITKTVSNWANNNCATLQQRAK